MRNGPVGLIGVGLLGRVLAERLLGAGFDVLAYDRDPRRLADAPARRAADAGEVAASCRRIVLCLPDDAAVSSVLRTLPLGRGQVVVDTTTGDPACASSLGACLARAGVRYLDASVAASSAQARRGQGLVFVGGPAGTVRSAHDLLRGLLPRVRHVGGWGNGRRMKLVHNLVLGLNRAALAEGLAFADSLGIPLSSALDALRESPAASIVMERKGPKMVARNFVPEARLSQHLKDVNLILAAARAAGLDLPLSRVHRTILSRAVARGWGELDNSAIFRTYERSR